MNYHLPCGSNSAARRVRPCRQVARSPSPPSDRTDEQRYNHVFDTQASVTWVDSTRTLQSTQSLSRLRPFSDSGRTTTKLLTLLCTQLFSLFFVYCLPLFSQYKPFLYKLRFWLKGKIPGYLGFQDSYSLPWEWLHSIHSEPMNFLFFFVRVWLKGEEV